MASLNITPLHVERGRQMRQIVQSDIVRLGYSFEQAVDALATYLGIDSESVKLGIAIANGADEPTCSICRTAGDHSLSCPTRWYRAA